MCHHSVWGYIIIYGAEFSIVVTPLIDDFPRKYPVQYPHEKTMKKSHGLLRTNSHPLQKLASRPGCENRGTGTSEADQGGVVEDVEADQGAFRRHR